MTCRERTPVENLNVGDVVQAVQAGPHGTVRETDCHGWTTVAYSHPYSCGVMSYKHGEDGLYVVRRGGVDWPATNAEELALRLADVAAVLASVTTDDDGEIAESNTGSLLAAFDYALRGERGLETPDEWQERRRQALARHGTYLGLSDPE